jgi:hypothetical protein
MAMQFTHSVLFEGNPDRAFDLACSSLTAIGFRLANKTESSLEWIGPGMHGSRQNPLMGASFIQIHHHNRELKLDAELGGIERMARFLKYFPAILLGGIGIVLSIVLLIATGPGVWVYPLFGVLAINAVVWMIVGPILTRQFRSRTEKSLDTLLNNMAAMS